MCLNIASLETFKPQTALQRKILLLQLSMTFFKLRAQMR